MSSVLDAPWFYWAIGVAVEANGHDARSAAA